MHSELEKLIAAIVADGRVTSKERTALHKAAARLGISNVEADVYLDAALMRYRREAAGHGPASGNSTANTGPSRESTCQACGASVDSLLSTCNFCGTAIQSRDMDSLSDEQLIRKASEWIEMIPEGTVNVFARGKLKVMKRGEISGKAAQHLSVLRVRAHSNHRIVETVRELEKKYEQANKRMSKDARSAMLGGLFLVVAIIFCAVMAGIFERRVEAAVKDLSILENQIQKEITVGHYDAARSLVVQLEWPNAADGDEENQDWSKKYAEKRRAYNETIDKAEARQRRK